jgi:carbonic anhydrase
MNSFLQAVTILVLIGSISGNLAHGNKKFERRNRNLERTLERAGGTDWSYAGQGNYWPVTHPFCGGKRQSPIDIDNSKVFNTDKGSLKFRKYGGIESGTLKNVGSSLKFTPDETAADLLPGIDDRNASFLNPMSNYKLLQFHFHWGSTNDRGSEHTVDGQSYAMEMHLVHVKKDYLDDVNEALASPDGLAVVGIMFVVGDEDFAPLQPMVDAALAIHEDQEAVEAADVELKKFLKEVGPSYYNYEGSLTTPTCNEVVTWYVMEGAIAISQAQLDAFRGLNYQCGAPMVDNFRPPQPLNNRIVKRVCPNYPMGKTHV